MPLTLTIVVASGGLVLCSSCFLVVRPTGTPLRIAAIRSVRLFTRRVLGAAASRAKAEASVVGTTVRSIRLFARRTLDALASEVKAEAVAVGVVGRMACVFARASLKLALFLFLGGVRKAQVVSKAQEDTRTNDRRAVGKERRKSLA